MDTSCSHNFLDVVLVKTLQLVVDATKILEVKVVNGDLIRTKGKCRDLLHKMQGHEFHLHVLILGGCDVVFGTQ